MLYHIPAQAGAAAQPAASTAAASHQSGFYLWGLVAEFSDLVVGAVLLLLIVFSLVCWIIIIYKAIFLRMARVESSKFLETFWESRRLDAIYQAADDLGRSPLAQIFKAGYSELSKLKGQKREESQAMHDQLGEMESLERALRRASTAEITAMESMVPFLATTGSTAPFIGLFGTVLGIVGSFHEIGAQGGAGFDIVAPGLADALFATAVGLVAAIPAVIAYNFFVRRIRVLSAEMETFSSDFLNIIQRHFLR
jgi:biopolymer transport protein TolQ